MKSCGRCHIEKQDSNFFKSPGTKDGLYRYCRDCKRKEYQAYKSIHGEKIKERNSLWRKNNPESSKKIWQAYNRKPLTKFKNYKINAARRGYSFDLSFEEFMSFWNKPCWYCGSSIETVGIDRLDSGIGYKQGNVISCCITCNWAKNTMTKTEFLVLSRKIAELHPEESATTCDDQRNMAMGIL